jgi:hypothetical protein
LGGVSQEVELLRRFWEDDSGRFSDANASSSEFGKSGPLLPLITLGESFKRALQGGLRALRDHLGRVLSPLVNEEYAILKTAISGVTG